MARASAEREFCIDDLLVRFHFIIVMIRWTGFAPWEFEFPCPGSLTYTFLGELQHVVCAGDKFGRFCGLSSVVRFQ